MRTRRTWLLGLGALAAAVLAAVAPSAPEPIAAQPPDLLRQAARKSWPFGQLS